MTIPNLTELTEGAVRQRLIERGFVLVTDRYQDHESHHTVFRLSNGVIVRVSDKEAVEGPPTVYRDACAKAGALAEDDIERLYDILKASEGQP